MNQTTSEHEFLARLMGSPTRAERSPGDGGLTPPQMEKWVAAAASSPEKRAAGVARLDAIMGMLPTDEDFARVPVEVPRRNAHPVDPKVYDGAGDEIGEVTRMGYVGLCPCESGNGFRVCHGAPE
jgi:hypothetical protein